ncbi:MAG: glyoxalase [Lachnospiraceae bacterium]|jgi:catechol 2,3-dioxygenase-like lactoylglutathione lyase family enzyme|nr:glyoxalase [Lachnospiraceae bacterium]
MKLKNILITVNDMETSIAFYRELFGLEVILNQDGNVILTEGLVLQDAKIWKTFLGKEILPKNNSCELYFEEKNIEEFAKKLENYKEPIEYVNQLMTHSWGQQVIRFYDPNGNLIEVGTPMESLTLPPVPAAHQDD